MSHDFPESDWKILRELKPLLLDRFCKRVLDELVKLAEATGESHHERYLNVDNRLHERDKELGIAFNDHRRSMALMRLAAIRSLGVLTDDELARFSPQTRADLERWSEIERP
jgi:hypothetical protein